MKTATLPSNLHSCCGGRLAGFVALGLAALLGSAVAPAQAVSPISRPATPAAGARPQAAAAPTQNSEEEKSEAKPDDANHHGITVHGHWKIDIKNPDGSLASTREFENSLADAGALLSNLLAGSAVGGERGVVIYLNDGYSPCAPLINSEGSIPATGSGGGGCVIAESSTGYWSSAYTCASNSALCSYNLNVSLSSDVGGSDLVLSGSLVAPLGLGVGGAIITRVATVITGCSSGAGYAVVTPAQCHAGTLPSGSTVGNLQTGTSNLPFTYVDVSSSELVVNSGQTIQVSVTLRFS